MKTELIPPVYIKLTKFPTNKQEQQDEITPELIFLVFLKPVPNKLQKNFFIIQSRNRHGLHQRKNHTFRLKNLSREGSVWGVAAKLLVAEQEVIRRTQSGVQVESTALNHIKQQVIFA